MHLASSRPHRTGRNGVLVVLTVPAVGRVARVARVVAWVAHVGGRSSTCKQDSNNDRKFPLVNQSINQSINQLSDGSINRSIDRSINYFVKQSLVDIPGSITARTDLELGGTPGSLDSARQVYTPVSSGRADSMINRPGVAS